MIEDTLVCLDRHVGAIVGVPSQHTVKQVNDRRAIITTLDRSRVWIAQTPQTFRYEPLLEAYRCYQPPPYPTDDAFLLEQRGERLTVVEGSYDNLKITTPEDLHVAEALLRMRNA
jgi:2-C-methyl-D-erythritol 4-phosphate cytidylyltransferase